MARTDDEEVKDWFHGSGFYEGETDDEQAMLDEFRAVVSAVEGLRAATRALRYNPDDLRALGYAKWPDYRRNLAMYSEPLEVARRVLGLH